MDENWDLWAVVRSCYTPATTSASATATKYVTPLEYPIPISVFMVFEQNNCNAFGRRNNGFEELDQVYRTSFAHSQPIINPLLGGLNHLKQPQPINPNGNPTPFGSVLSGFNHQKQEPPPPHPQPMNPNIIHTTPSSFVFGNSSKLKTHSMTNPNIIDLEEEQKPQPINPNIMDKEDEAEQNPQLINTSTVLLLAQKALDTTISHGCEIHKKAELTLCERVVYNTMIGNMTTEPSIFVLGESSNQQPPPPPPTKNQHYWKHPQPPPRSQRTAAVEVDAENLSEVDPWNWRKYGRKPIKTSPYPRNYYKCSSEGNKCEAKKYVEKSLEDPEKFMVSYSGKHHHSPPRRRNTLSCTTRLKSSTTTKKASCSNEDAVHDNVTIEVEDDDDKEGILNSENVFMGLQDLVDKEG
ncbi:unnamed protein product [Camellia sinensis]